jgi:hypothetical protein
MNHHSIEENRENKNIDYLETPGTISSDMVIDSCFLVIY